VIGLIPLRRWQAGDAGLSVVLALQMATLFVASPLAATHVVPVEVVELFRLSLAAAAVLLVTGTVRSAVVVLGAVLASIALASATRLGMNALATALERDAASGVFDLALLTVVSRSVFTAGRVNVHRILGAVIVYLTVGLVFASAYRACELLLHPSFSAAGRAAGPSDMLYFSFTTLTTTGYGDIAPVHPFVRSLANLEAVIGQLYPATLLARLVTLHATAAGGGSGDV
jgi:hypothetical protein